MEHFCGIIQDTSQTTMQFWHLKKMLIYRGFVIVFHDYQIKHVCKLGANKHIFKFNTIVNFFGNGFSNT
jgi:hypothetical protein